MNYAQSGAGSLFFVCVYVYIGGCTLGLFSILQYSPKDTFLSEKPFLLSRLDQGKFHSLTLGKGH